jgi:hypothetical protein
VRKILAGVADVATANDGLVTWLVATGGAKAQVIPSAASIPGGQILSIKDGFGDCNLNPITVTPAGGTIEGQASYVIDIRGSKIDFISDGVANWIVG